jgi:hypothetical protein
MWEGFLPNLIPIGAVCGTLGLIFLLAAFVALGARRGGAFIVRGFIGLTLLALALLLGAVGLGVQNYHALTREEVAARISVIPSGPQRFDARFRFADGTEASYVLAGDELNVDAHILKWKPLAQYLGLHTVYELDRVAGRYRSVEHERTATRTVFPLRERPLIDLFDLRQRYVLLAPLVDAEYGAATFLTVNRPAELELRVSTTGLLIREAPPEPRK